MKTEEEIRNSYKFDWTRALIGRDEKDPDFTFPDTFKEEDLGDKDLDDIYRDQAPYNSQFMDRCFSSVFLEYGLKSMEGWMIYQIQKGSEYSKEDLEYMIRRNPHLHNIIKTNLLQNLNDNI